MSTRTFYFTIFLSIAFSFISFWDHPFMNYTKEFVVLVHEICHAIAALLTGGEVRNITIHGNQSGQTVAIPSSIRGSFLFVVSAGYLGTALIGAVLLYRGLIGNKTKSTLIIFGIIVFFITLKYANVGEFTYTVGIAWSIAILFISFLGKQISSIFLVFLGTTFSLYSIYDLSDFTDSIHQTDAGILAYWLTGYNSSQDLSPPASVLILGYLIAITWSMMGIGIIYTYVKRGIFHSEEEHYASESANGTNILPGDFQEMFPGELTPEVVDWFLSKGLDLNGRPLSGELVDGIQKDSEMS
ncbi:MAG: peptidase M50 [Leptospira sp.]|nr:MAG: peptidase M50 [Leptospira sp.]